MRRLQTADLVGRVEQACLELVAADQAVTFDAVAARAGVGRATLYRRSELRALVDEHRLRAQETLTLTGLSAQIEQLRAALEAVAAKVRRHEEVLRHLKKEQSSKDRHGGGLAG